MMNDAKVAPASVLIRGGTIIKGGPRSEVFGQGDLWVAGSRIEAITPPGQRQPPAGCCVIDVPGCIVIPGLIDTHRHLWQTPLRGLGADLTAPEYRSRLRASYGPCMTPDDLYVATLAGAVEALEAGVTTIVDWAHIMNSPAHADATVAALSATGMRSVFAYSTPNDAEAESWYSRSTRRHPADIRRVRRDVLPGDDALVTLAFGARSPHLLSRETMVHDWNLARELGLRITVDGGLGGGQWGERHYPIRLLEAERLLGDDTTYIHCNNLAPDEYEAIAASGAHISMSPCAEMNVGHGMPATGRALAAGVRPCLSTDYVTQVSGDLFENMRMALSAERGLQAYLASQRGSGVPPWTLRTSDVLEFATYCGARSLGMATRIGSIEVGKEADITIVGTGSLHMSPVNDPVAGLVQYAGPADVHTVLVAGKVLKSAGKLVGRDAARLREDLVALRDRISAKSRSLGVNSSITAYSW